MSYVQDQLMPIIEDNPGTRDAYIAQYILDHQPSMSLLDYDNWTAAERILGFAIDAEDLSIISHATEYELNEYEGDPDARLIFLGALLITGRARYDSYYNSFSAFEIFGKPALFTDNRGITQRNILALDSLYSYDLRHGDDFGIPLTLEEHVVVNWFGRVYTLEPLLEEGQTRRDIGEDDWSYCSDEEDMTPLQFIEKYKKEEK